MPRRGRPALPGACALRTLAGWTSPLVAVGVVGVSVALSPPHEAGAQEQARITVSPYIVAKAASEAVLPIAVGPANVVPARSFVSLAGMPPEVSLTDGHRVAPGAWAVPLSALPTLDATIPAGVSGRAEIVIRLIGMDGTLLAQARTALIVEPSPGLPAQQPPAAQAAPAQAALAAPQMVAPERGKPTTPARELAPSEKARAETFVARGLDYLAIGNVGGARDFFERAADLGLAAGALRLAATYDPVELERLKVQGIVPNRALARKWYERAQDLGAPEAAARLAKLGSSN
jgi:hypothetical protein